MQNHAVSCDALQVLAIGSAIQCAILETLIIFDDARFSTIHKHHVLQIIRRKAPMLIGLRDALVGLKAVAATLLIVCMAMFTGCGGPNTPAMPPPSATPQLMTIAVGPPDTSVAMGLTHQFSATGLYSDGSKQDVSSS